MPSLVVIRPQIKEKRGGGQNSLYMVLKDPSLNRVNDSAVRGSLKSKLQHSQNRPTGDRWLKF